MSEEEPLEQEVSPAEPTAEQPEGDSELDVTADELSAQQELQRAERRIWTWLIVAGVVVAVLFLIGFWPVMAGRLDAAKKLDQAVALIDQAAGSMAPVDKAVLGQLAPDAAPSAPAVKPEILVARRELNQAAALIDEAMPHLTEDEQRRGELARTALKSRLTMLQTAPGILTLSARAVRAKSLGDQAWKLTRTASSAETSAVDAYRKQTATAMQSVVATLPVIQADLVSARALYSAAATTFPAAGFARYQTYIDLRRTAAKQLGTAAKLWLAGDTALARVTFSAYETSAGKAAKVGATLPHAPGAAVGSAFLKLQGKAVTSYREARKNAAEAEKALKTP